MQAFAFDNDIQFKFTCVNCPRGAGRRKIRGNFLDHLDDLRSKPRSCLIKIDNNDSLCLARALVTAKAHRDKDDGDDAARAYETIRKGDKSRCFFLYYL